jgi:hypothetical protein
MGDHHAAGDRIPPTFEKLKWAAASRRHGVSAAETALVVRSGPTALR